MRKPSCGKILLHAKRQVTAFREFIGVQVCVFKIGVTADPAFRFRGYMAKGYTNMWVIHVNEDVGETHMLEAALIAEFQELPGCRNAPNSGGEGALNRKQNGGPPYYTYVTGCRADVFKRIG